jgi:glucokinase
MPHENDTHALARTHTGTAAMNPFDSPRLIADIGGSYARFALETAPGRFEHAASLRCVEHADFHAAVSAYLATVSTRPPLHAAIAIANPVEGDQIRMTNYHWRFSSEQMRQRLNLETLVVVNDFTALAMSLPKLAPTQRRQVGGGAPVARSVIGLLGAGSGLGVSGLIPAAQGWVALGTEGGHASFAPRGEREIAILQFALGEFEHVSCERLVSGPGIELIYRALLKRACRRDEPLGAPEITRHALAGTDPVCLEALEAFCAMLGTVASNLAMTFGAKGGIYIGGGIVPRLGAYFDRSPFRTRFEQKGRFGEYARAIPTYVITAEQATFVGAATILAEQLRGLQDHPGSAILAQIQRTLGSLSPAERRVADHVLLRPRSALGDPIAEIARAAQVSQPTVIRFCRSLGCEGLSDFKLRLASGLGATVPVTHTQVTGDDSTLEIGAKVLGNTASALLAARDELNRETIARAIELLSAAERVEIHASGYFAPVALDAQLKFLRFGVPSAACTEPRLQALSAGVMRPGEVLLIVSGNGRRAELLAAADMARSRGASVLAITAPQSPLARKADIALLVNHAEDVATQVPMISRILQLLVIDILVVGVAMRRGTPVPAMLDAGAALAARATSQVAGQPVAAAPSAQRTGPGISLSSTLASLTSHSR